MAQVNCLLNIIKLRMNGSIQRELGGLFAATTD